MNRKKQSTEANTMTQMLELSKKDFKAAVINMHKQAIINTLETNEKQKASLGKEKEPNGNCRTENQFHSPGAKRNLQN